MNILVIGGNRFFGKRLVERLIERGDQVTLLNRGKTPDDFGDRVDRIVLDRRNLHKDHPELGDRKWDIVYDQVCYDAAEARGSCETFRGRVGRYIFTSTQSVYGRGANIAETEFDPLLYSFEDQISRDQDYAGAKRQAETVFFQDAPFPITAVRFPIVLGEDDYTGRLKFHVDAVKEGETLYFPNLRARISFVHAADAASCLASFGIHDMEGAVNCCSPEPISLLGLVAMIEGATGRKAKITDSPERGSASPFGIEEDWFMSISKLRVRGPAPRSMDLWLPNLIQYFAKGTP